MSKKPKGIISNQLRKKRFEKDEMTQQELAKALGLTGQTITAIEAGKYSPSLEVAFFLNRYFSPLMSSFNGKPKRMRSVKND